MVERQNALLTFQVLGLRIDSRMGEVCKPITGPAEGGGYGWEVEPGKSFLLKLLR